MFGGGCVGKDLSEEVTLQLRPRGRGFLGWGSSGRLEELRVWGAVGREEGEVEAILASALWTC